MNNVFLVGRIANTPRVYEKDDMTRVDFLFAVDSGYKDETDFIQCVAWGKIASVVQEYCRKGDLEALSGHLNGRFYKNHDNKDQYHLNVVIDHIQFLEKKEDES